MTIRTMSGLLVPSLETARLRLRGHRLDDFPHCARMWADPAVTRYIRPTPFTHEESWARTLRYVGHWALLGYGYWVVEEKSTGRFLGEAGFANYHRDIEPPLLNDIPEAGWAFAAEAHGQGYGSEALAAIIAWGDTHFQTPTGCIIDQQNLASIRIAEKSGYRPKQLVKYRGD